MSVDRGTDAPHPLKRSRDLRIRVLLARKPDLFTHWQSTFIESRIQLLDL